MTTIILVLFIPVIFLITDHIAYGKEVPAIESLQGLNRKHRHALAIFATVAIIAFTAVPLLMDRVADHGFSLKNAIPVIFAVSLFRLGKDLGLSSGHSILASSIILTAWWLFPGIQVISLGISLATCLVFPVVFKSAPTAVAIILVTIMMVVDPASVFKSDAMQVHANTLAHTPAIINFPHDCFVASIGTLDIAFPGILVLMAMRLGRILRKQQIGWWSIVGYLVGFGLTMLASVYRHSQPVMFYVVPTTMLSFFVSAYCYGNLTPLEILRKR